MQFSCSDEGADLGATTQFAHMIAYIFLRIMPVDSAAGAWPWLAGRAIINGHEVDPVR